jgi:uncharacterized protein YprB with RNaseH-like and TPR domain
MRVGMKRLDLYRLGRESVEGPRPRIEKPQGVEAVRNGRIRLLDELRGLVAGELVSREGQSLLKIERTIPLGHLPGSPGLLKAFSSCMENAATLFPRLDQSSRPTGLGDLLFFDIETTGLSGGAGTYLFLAGFARVTGTDFLCRQYFMHGLSAERMFLDEIGRELLNAKFLVSYNGRSYDYNILRNRYILTGLPFFSDEPVHLDLLYTSRRIWRGLIPDFTLSTVENRVLGISRFDDIPGWQIPGIYADYLRGRDVCGDVARIISHNRDDVQSLLVLLVKQLGLLSAATGNGTLQGERYNPVALSDMLEAGQRREEARALLSVHRDSTEALKRLMLIYKRDFQFEHALSLIEELLTRKIDLVDFIFVCTEAAKIYEHRMGDCESALRYTERMLRRLERARYFKKLDSRNEGELDVVQHRLNRLKRKLGRVPETNI